MQVLVPPEVFDRVSLAVDLRVLNGRGELAQSAVFFGRTADVVRVEWKPAQLVNRAFEPAKLERATLDFGQPVLKNRVRLTLSGDNYRRRALVEASTDTLAWESVAENLFLFDISLPGKQFKVDTLEFPEQQLPIPARDSVQHAGRPAAGGNRVGGGRAGAQDRGEGTVPVEGVANGVAHGRQAEGEHLRVGPALAQPAGGARIVRDRGRFFDRAFELYGRNSTTETVTVRIEGGTEKREVEAPWPAVGSGVLYRISNRTRRSSR